ncbi:hypothetical protein PS627_03073 [Pseudomonas fluorescens]|uniref:hypothetical protein n=1 Tax=Pseudomonas fluorescens TaxID=294 RepID=UPI00125A7108|nr:hypothetical protein [Pseudomonas fluorescens]CAG8868693.1 hypothetical protein PS627_03073 [Pseudomonas fluorescens]VVP68809.1 hypothetical protein PS910_00436 [Pseudomonas fluorescens]
MLQFKSIGTPLVVLLAALSMSGCEQAEKSAQLVLDQAAESARQAIDQTSKAAQQALNDTLGTEPGKSPREADDKNQTQDI